MTLTIENPKDCGLGEGEKCCAFLVMGAGFQCGRTDEGLAMTILSRLFDGTMNAKYNPGLVPFPECQTDRPKETA